MAYAFIPSYDSDAHTTLVWASYWEYGLHPTLP